MHVSYYYHANSRYKPYKHLNLFCILDDMLLPTALAEPPTIHKICKKENFKNFNFGNTKYHFGPNILGTIVTTTTETNKIMENWDCNYIRWNVLNYGGRPQYLIYSITVIQFEISLNLYQTIRSPYRSYLEKCCIWLR